MNDLRVLIVEDSIDDEQLLLRALKRAGYTVTWERVQTADDMAEALRRTSWDVVISDYTMPRFSARGALAVLHESGLDLPFIIVSGTVGEEVAVEALKAGAHDFLVKGRFARLAPIIERERREAVNRRAHQEAERALRTSETRYRTIVVTAQEGIWTLDADGKTTYLNQRMASMLGCEPDDVLDRPFLDFVHGEWRETAAAVVRGAGNGVTELLFHRDDGSEFWGTFSVSEIQDPESRRIGTLAMVVDTTQQRQLNAQLMVADRLVSVGMLAAGVAHEINNPLAAVLFQLDVAMLHLDGTRNGAPTREVLDRGVRALRQAKEASIRVRDIVRDLRIFSRGNEEETGPVDIHSILDSTVRLAWNEVRHRARLTTDYGAVDTVLGNESRLGQVFLNLVVNAAQAIAEGAAPSNEIRIVTRSASDDEVLVEICDTGCGMSQDVLRHLFVPFFTTKPVGVGTGLGLSICHRIIASLGGRMSVESTVGKGTTIRVFLPVAGRRDAETVTGADAPAEGAGANLRGRVLIIDDDALVLSSLEDGVALEHEVSATTSAQEALRWIAGGARFDVILCDVMMPSMTGEEFYAELGKIAPDQTATVVFLTGGAFTPQARSFFETIPNAKLNKPVSLHDVMGTISSFLTQSNAFSP